MRMFVTKDTTLHKNRKFPLNESLFWDSFEYFCFRPAQINTYLISLKNSSFLLYGPTVDWCEFLRFYLPFSSCIYRGDRYDQLRICIGNNAVQKLQKLKLFMVSIV